jgi:hypothetical protein
MLTISEAARALSVLDGEIQEIEADVRAVKRQQRELEARERELIMRLELMRTLGRAIVEGEFDEPVHC